MAINVNGYNDAFQEFAIFAKIMVDGQGNAHSIARLSTGVNVVEGVLAGRTIPASDTDSVYRRPRHEGDAFRKALARVVPVAGALDNRNTTTDTFMGSILDTYGHGSVHDLQISPAGKTATITQSMTDDLSSPGLQMNNQISFGQVTFSQCLAFNLTTDIPAVTDFKIPQEFI